MLAAQRESTAAKVLIVTGGLVDGGTAGMPASELSAGWWWDSLVAQLSVLRKSRQAVALALHGKLSFVEPAFHCALEQKLRPPHVAAKAVDDFDVSVTVTEVALATLLARQSIAFEAASLAALVAQRDLRERMLRECDVVFVSSTLMLDLTELEIATELVKRPWNKVVVGGTLVADLHRRWKPLQSIDVLAIGYGEHLVPSLATWIRGEYRALSPPPNGSLRVVGSNQILHAGTPASRSLDELPSPDWSLAMSYHGRPIRVAGYESVRGCPYRCAFCDYPFLFDDNKFRMRSAKKIAADWELMAAQGVEFIICLDSLFTMPKRRLVELCELLIERQVNVEWLCYARADDLEDVAVTELMRRAGCRSVNVGVESGSQLILDNMNKRSTVLANGIGIRNARAAGIRVTANFVVGFPGETPETLAETLAFIETYRPDACGVYPLNLGSAVAPILSEASRKRFGLRTSYDGRVQNPHWAHDTMTVVDAIDWAHWLRAKVMERGVAIDSALMDAGLERRDELLRFQQAVATRRPWLRAAFSGLRACTRELARHEMRRTLDGKAHDPQAASGRSYRAV